jgi:glycerol-3-phosphate cytidylyltransferase
MSKVIGFTCGTFDLCHYGHIIAFSECKSMCDELVVAVQTDPTLDRKWKNKPVQSITERLGQVWAVKFVDRTITYRTEEDLLQILKSLKPDKRFVSEEYKGKKFTGHDLGNVVYTKKNKDYTTADLKKRVLDSK